ncbi:MarR family transcriptional regulator (plasmid) [Shinella sp. H4-D48]|uniref:MarR family winged helix-turn-helix transcriptional regulator n=1 Tax=Shinella sp. H4-D48 TaxID=2925841 RepID=UPI001F535182|nr:MarR family transcriptional regulator [Shinella sp. H4-D48]UNK39938.1 MarR family transcriptional regulator [Shinella sp. H4-D48]
MHLVDLICSVNRKFEQSIEANLKPHGLSIEQYRVLRALDVVDGMPMGDLAARVFVDSPTLTRIIDKMVASADVYRGPDPEDRRRVLVFISDKGAEALARVESIGNDAQRQLNAKLGDEGSAELEEVLYLLLSDAKSVVPAKDDERTMTSRSSP